MKGHMGGMYQASLRCAGVSVLRLGCNVLGLHLYVYHLKQ